MSDKPTNQPTKQASKHIYLSIEHTTLENSNGEVVAMVAEMRLRGLTPEETAEA